MAHNPESTTVLVTGASGFIGAHCVLQLLQAGYNVRGTLRDFAREEGLREALAKHHIDQTKLTFVLADLLQDAGWEDAVNGCDFVLHVASPAPASIPKHEDDLIIPAREGTLRVLQAAAKFGVSRVVITSSLAAILYAHHNFDKTLDENDWSDLNGKIPAYPKSKTMAEQAAWEFVDNLGAESDLELAVINPVYVLGPSIDGRSYSGSGEIVRKLMMREIPGSPRIQFHICDVRDVAAAHLTAMTSEAAAGRRYIASSGARWGKEVALTLADHFGSRGYRVPTRQLPDFVVRFVALFDGTVKLIVDDLGRDITLSTERIESDLNWQGRPPEESIVDTAENMIEFGII